MKKITSINAREQKKNSADVSDAEELQQIRELLFGQQSREHDQRSEELNTLFDSRIAELNNNVERQLKRIDQRLQSLSQSIEREAEARGSAVQELGNVSDSSIEMITDLAAKHDASSSQLNNLIVEEAANTINRNAKLEQLLAQRHEEQSDALNERTKAERERFAIALRAIAAEVVREDGKSS